MKDYIHRHPLPSQQGRTKSACSDITSIQSLLLGDVNLGEFRPYAAEHAYSPSRLIHNLPEIASGVTCRPASHDTPRVAERRCQLLPSKWQGERRAKSGRQDDVILSFGRVEIDEELRS